MKRTSGQYVQRTICTDDQVSRRKMYIGVDKGFENSQF